MQHKSSFLLFELEFPEMFERVSTRAMDILTLLGVLYIFVSMVIAARLGGNVAFALGMLALVVLLVKVGTTHHQWDGMATCVVGCGVGYWT